MEDTRNPSRNLSVFDHAVFVFWKGLPGSELENKTFCEAFKSNGEPYPLELARKWRDKYLGEEMEVHVMGFRPKPDSKRAEWECYYDEMWT